MCIFVINLIDAAALRFFVEKFVTATTTFSGSDRPSLSAAANFSSLSQNFLTPTAHMLT